MPGKEQQPCDPVTGLVRMVKGRILVCSLKEGMSHEEVLRILGTCNGWSMNLGHDSSVWDGYGIVVNFTPPIALRAGSEARIVSVHWHVPYQIARWFSPKRLALNPVAVKERTDLGSGLSHALFFLETIAPSTLTFQLEWAIARIKMFCGDADCPGNVNKRMRELLNTSEDLRRIEEEWDKISPRIQTRTGYPAEYNKTPELKSRLL